MNITEERLAELIKALETALEAEKAQRVKHEEETDVKLLELGGKVLALETTNLLQQQHIHRVGDEVMKSPLIGHIDRGMDAMYVCSLSGRYR